MRLSNLSLALTAVYGPTALTISQLLPSGAGRVAAIYSDPARPSYDECIQKNMDALGPELVVNGGFDSASGWTLDPVASITGGKLNVGTAPAKIVATRTDAAIVPGRVYCVSFTLTVISGSNFVSAAVGGNVGAIANTSGRHTDVIVAGATGTIHLQGRSAGTTNCTIDDISVREIDLSKCVLFADAAGQTPVLYPIGAGQGKGLLLDRSAGLVRGPELVTNGENITSTSGWSVFNGGTLSASGGSLTVTNGGSGYSGAQVNGLGTTVTVGKTYAIQIVVSGGTATNRRATIVGVANNTLNLGVNHFVLTATSSTVTFFINSATVGETLSISRYSVRELPGHHQQQPTAAARGEFSRRYNLLTATEDFTDAVWEKRNGATVVANAAIAPDGTLTADKFVPGAGAIGSVAFANTNIFAAPGVVSLVAGTTYTLSVYAKAGELSVLTLYLDPNTNTYITADLATGTILNNVGSIPGTIDSVGGGWYRLAITDLATETSAIAVVRIAAETPSGDGTSGIYIWGADLRLAADAIPSIPAYQRVNTASDYDEVGFPTYWRAQTDDWAKSHMDPNGATKAYVFWAGQKMSDAAFGVILEHSPTINSNVGTLAMYAPGGAGTARLDYLSRGSASSPIPIATTTAHAAPSRVCMVGKSDIANDITQLTVNGAATTSTADQGTGTYTEQDVFFASRAGTGSFANIREYAPPTILFLQSADSLSASHLAKLQKGYAKAVGVTL